MTTRTTNRSGVITSTTKGIEASPPHTMNDRCVRTAWISVFLRSLLRQTGSNIAQETKLAAEYHEKSGAPQIACVYCRHLGDLITSATPEAGWSCKLVEGIVDTRARCRNWQGSPWPAGVSKTYPSSQSVSELREQAAGYRRAAQTTRIAKVRDGLFKLADRFDTLADEREQQACRG